MKRLMLALSITLTLQACEDYAPPPEDMIIGGSCSYRTTETTATVEAVSADGWTDMKAADGTTFRMRYSEFTGIGLVPEPGARFVVNHDEITSGTCVPSLYKLIAPVTEQVSADTADQQEPPLIGGPCSYKQDAITASILQIDGEDVALIDPSGTPFWLDLAAFRPINPAPQAGDRFEIIKSSIVSGTCTPYSYTVGRQLTD